MSLLTKEVNDEEECPEEVIPEKEWRAMWLGEPLRRGVPGGVCESGWAHKPGTDASPEKSRGGISYRPESGRSRVRRPEGDSLS